MRELNIAILVPIFPNILQTYVLNHLASLKAMNFNISIIASRKRKYNHLPPIITSYNLLNNVTYVNTKAIDFIKSCLLIFSFNKKYIKTIGRILKSNKYFDKTYIFKSILRARPFSTTSVDIMHSHSLFSSYEYLLIKELHSIPLVTTYHGQVPRGVRKLEESKLRMVLDMSDHFVVNTEYARDELASLGCNMDKIHIIPQGTNIQDFPYKRKKIDTTRPIILLTVGRLSVEKGHHIAMQSVALLRNTLPTLEYHIVGEGPERDNLEKLSVALNIADKVFFHGLKTGAELKQIYKTAHIFVLPSINTKDGYLVETQGVVLQEAQAAGICVIGSRVGGIADVISDGTTGFLYEDSSEEELAELINKLSQNIDIYEKISVAGRADVEKRFDIEVVKNQLISLYNEALEQTT